MSTTESTPAPQSAPTAAPSRVSELRAAYDMAEARVKSARAALTPEEEAIRKAVFALPCPIELIPEIKRLEAAVRELKALKAEKQKREAAKNAAWDHFKTTRGGAELDAAHIAASYVRFAMSKLEVGQ